MTKIQIASDLHLEFYDNPKLKDFLDVDENSKSDIGLLLMGDIGIPYLSSYEKFIQECSNSYKFVCIIAGNHEYYQYKNKSCTYKLDIDATDSKIKNIVDKYPNVHFLNNDIFEIDNDTIILGTTLWSLMDLNLTSYFQSHYNDLRNIYIGNKYISPKNINNIHTINKNWLKDQINKYSNKNIIIMSHHLPSYKMISPKYESSLINSAFASNLDNLIKSNIKYWLCGHTHSNINITINNCQCITNPLGYKNENPEFERNYILTI